MAECVVTCLRGTFHSGQQKSGVALVQGLLFLRAVGGEAVSPRSQETVHLWRLTILIQPKS